MFTRYGKCYTFNGKADDGRLLTTLKGGVDNGLEVLLDTEQDNYIPVWAESGETCESNTFYILVTIKILASTVLTPHTGCMFVVNFLTSAFLSEKNQNELYFANITLPPAHLCFFAAAQQIQ